MTTRKPTRAEMKLIEALYHGATVVDATAHWLRTVKCSNGTSFTTTAALFFTLREMRWLEPICGIRLTAAGRALVEAKGVKITVTNMAVVPAKGA